jgi:hypothetical protein
VEEELLAALLAASFVVLFQDLFQVSSVARCLVQAPRMELFRVPFLAKGFPLAFSVYPHHRA